MYRKKRVQQSTIFVLKKEERATILSNRCQRAFKNEGRNNINPCPADPVGRQGQQGSSSEQHTVSQQRRQKTREAGRMSGLTSRIQANEAQENHTLPALFDDGAVFHGGIAAHVDISGTPGELKADEPRV